MQTALQRLSARLAPTSNRAPHDADNPNEARRGARERTLFRLRGYYLGLLNNRNGPAVAGPSHALFYNSPPDRSTVVRPYEIFRRVTLLEHVLGLAAHGTIREYSGAYVEPACDCVPPRYAQMVDEIARAIERFCADFSEPEIYGDERGAQGLLDALISTWFAFPCEAALAILAQVEASEDPNNLGADLMVKEYSLREAVIILLPDRLRSVLKVPVPRRLWPEASLCISKPWPARLIRLRSRLDRLLSAIRRRAAHLRRMG